MHEEQSTQNLVDKVLNMIITELLPRIDHSMKIGFHEISDDINVSVTCFCFRFKYIDDSNDIIVFEEF